MSAAFRIVPILCIMLIAACTSCHGGNSAQQMVMLQVTPVDDLHPFSIDRPIADSARPGTFASSYCIPSQGDERKITASLEGFTGTLNVHFSAPEGAQSAGTVPLSSTHRNLITGRPQTTDRLLPIRYTSSSGAPASGSLIFTVTGD